VAIVCDGVRAVSLPEHENAVGTVLNVIPNDAHVDAFTIYDIEFQFGTFALRGTQIEADAGNTGQLYGMTAV
jgi:hypothetical protein